MKVRLRMVLGASLVGILTLAGWWNRGQGVTDRSTEASPSIVPYAQGARSPVGSLSDEDAEHWIDFFNRTLGIMVKTWTKDGRTIEAQDKQAALAEFMNANVDAMPPSVKYIYQLARLEWLRDWREPWDPGSDNHLLELMAVRQQLMSPRKGLQDQLSDADLLMWIARTLLFGSIRPPRSVIDQLAASGGNRLDYSREHYVNIDQAIETLDYVVTHFDMNYITTANAFYLLARERGVRDPREGIAELRRFMKINLDNLYSLPYRDLSQHPVGQAVLEHLWALRMAGRIVRPPEELRSVQRNIPFELLEFASEIVPAVDALGEMDAIMNEFASVFAEAQTPGSWPIVAFHLLSAAMRKALEDDGIHSREEAMSALERIPAIAEAAVRSLKQRYPSYADAFDRLMKDFSKPSPMVISMIYYRVR